MQLKNLEIISLNKRVQDLEKIKNEMLFDLERYENEFQAAENKFFNKEYELKDQLQIFELEKNNLLKKLDYYHQIFPSKNSNFNNPCELMSLDNKKILEELKIKNEKLELFSNFYIKLQTLLLNKTTQITILDNLDIVAFKYRFNEIIESIKKLH